MTQEYEPEFSPEMLEEQRAIDAEKSFKGDNLIEVLRTTQTGTMLSIADIAEIISEEIADIDGLIKNLKRIQKVVKKSSLNYKKIEPITTESLAKMGVFN